MLVNAKSVFLGCKYAIIQMLVQEPHESGDRGWIVNISSIYGVVGGGDNREYSHSFEY
jgi:NAD(P)-dependent dehydrogenase (short-subunit alcohol dehydrogenase family)